MKVLNKIKKYFNSSKFKEYKKNIKMVTSKFKDYFWIIIPFVLMELFTQLFSYKISFINYRVYSPILFGLKWVLLFIGLSLCFKNKIGKYIYLFINFLFLIIFTVENVYFSMTNTVFDFNLLNSASEGAPYIMDALANCNIFVYMSIVIVIGFIIYGFKKLPVIKKNHFGILGIIFVIFMFFHFFVPVTLGSADKDLTWSSWRNARNIYNSFNDSNKSLKISGFYEYSIRDFYF